MSHELLARWRPSSVHMVILLTFALSTAIATAGTVTWVVDSTNSYVRLTIPDQTINVTNVGNVTVQMRNASSTTQWTDAGGRRAALTGEIVTDYEDGSSITFLGGAHNLQAVEATGLRPNPAAWSVGTTNYTNSSTALAALGGRVRGMYSILTFDVAYLAFREMRLDITNATGEAVAITNGTFAGQTTGFGFASGLVDVDGLVLPLNLGQPIPDILHADLTPVVATNAGSGTITNLGGQSRKLTYTINMSSLVFDLGGTLVNGSAAGLVVAHAVLPTPPPMLNARKSGTGLVLAWATNGPGFVLEYATSLPATNWLAASPPPVVVDGQNVVTNTMTGQAVFYRLRQP